MVDGGVARDGRADLEGEPALADAGGAGEDHDARIAAYEGADLVEQGAIGQVAVAHPRQGRRRRVRGHDRTPADLYGAEPDGNAVATRLLADVRPQGRVDEEGVGGRGPQEVLEPVHLGSDGGGSAGDGVPPDDGLPFEAGEPQGLGPRSIVEGGQGEGEGVGGMREEELPPVGGVGAVVADGGRGEPAAKGRDARPVDAFAPAAAGIAEPDGGEGAGGAPGGLLVELQAAARTADGDEVARNAWPRLDLGAQAVQRTIDAPTGRSAEHPREGGPIDHAPATFCEEIEQGDLSGGEPGGLAVALDEGAIEIDGPIGQREAAPRKRGHGGGWGVLVVAPRDEAVARAEDGEQVFGSGGIALDLLPEPQDGAVDGAADDLL